VADIFSQVDEDLRRDKYEELWKRYGKLIIAGAVAVVLAAGAFVGWQEYSKRARTEAGGAFTAAKLLSDEGRNAEAAAAFAALANDGVGEYATIARLEEAAAIAATGNRARAVALYDNLSADLSAGDVFGELAALLAAQNVLDDGDVAGARQRLEPLIGAGKAWRFSALEMIALAALADGDIESARKGFKELTDDDMAPQGVRTRSAEMLAALGGSD
jgi:hypothetical protein